MQGSCHCQDVKFELLGEVKKVVNCHCNLCRKMNGAPFSTYAVSLANDFKLLHGDLRSIKLTDKATKFVCSQCCSPIYNQNQRFNGLNMLYLGALDQAEALPAEVNLYTATKLTWLDGLNEMPSLEQGVG